jgi:hypothetical protein
MRCKNARRPLMPVPDLARPQALPVARGIEPRRPPRAQERQLQER